MDFDLSKLKGRIVEKYNTLTSFADALEVPLTVVSDKVNQKRQLTRKDIVIWSELLDIAPEDIGTYFFTIKV